MTIYTIERDFGLSLGENNLVTTLKHTPLSSFAAVMDHLPVGTVIDADCDLFVPVAGNTLYVVADEYVEVPADELTSPLADGKNVTETYIAGADEDGIVYREMRYVMLDDGSYAVDNDCYASSFDAAANTETYYRHIIYTAYDSSVRYGEDTAAVEAVFGKSDTYVAMVERGDTAREQALSDALHGMDGGWSSMRIVTMLISVVVLGMWVIFCFIEGRFIPLGWETVTLLVGAQGAKAAQLRFELGSGGIPALPRENVLPSNALREALHDNR